MTFTGGNLTPSLPPFLTLFSPLFELIKIYIGQLPLEITEQQLTEIIQPLAEVQEVRIIKGDHTRGRYQLYCYAFVTIKGNQAFSLEVVRQLKERFPTWKMNLKNDYDRQRTMSYHNTPMQLYYPPIPPIPYPYSHLPIPSSEKIVGEKTCHVLVRQLRLANIPQTCDKACLAQIMSQYGIIEEIDLFPNSTFVKYKQVSEATTAFERAEEIVERLGNPPCFQMYFSDPLRRAFIVSNHYEYDRQSPSLPVLYIGFPPVTSATVEMEVIKPICEKYGPIINEYLRKNSSNRNRPYFLFTYESVKDALKAKVELSRRKDLLGDRRVEVALLLDQQIIMKGRDLTRTVALFQAEDRIKGQGYAEDGNLRNSMRSYPVYPNMLPPVPYMPYYQPYPPYYEPSYYHNFVENGQMSQNQNRFEPSQINKDIDEFLKGVLTDTGNNDQERKLLKTGEQKDDILWELLGQKKVVQKQGKQKRQIGTQKAEEEQKTALAGFLTWKGVKRVGVEARSSTVQLQDYSINILSLIEFNNLALNQRNTMVLQPLNSADAALFKAYTDQLKTHAGVAMNKTFLMYVLGKSEHSDQISPITQNQLLVVLEKASTLTLICGKLIRCEDLQFP